MRRARLLVAGWATAACLGAVAPPGLAAGTTPPSPVATDGEDGTGAARAPPAAPPFAARAALVLTRFRYEELDEGGARLDRERGVVPGVAVEASWRRGDWGVSGELAYARGAVDYDGRASNGAPITTRTGEALRTGALRVRRSLELGGIAVVPHGAVGHRRWERTIRPTRTASGARVNGLDETYAWWSAEAGVEVLVVSGERLRASVDGSVFRTLGATVEVEFANELDDARLDLGEGTGHRLGVSGSFAVIPSVELRLGLQREAWGFGRSADAALTRGGVRVGSVHEPRSETANVALTAGLGARF